MDNISLKYDLEAIYDYQKVIIVLWFNIIYLNLLYKLKNF